MIRIYDIDPRFMGDFAESEVEWNGAMWVDLRSVHAVRKKHRWIEILIGSFPHWVDINESAGVFLEDWKSAKT